MVTEVNVDDLAQIIRRVDGNHSLGAGELAEAILTALSPPIKAGEAVPERVTEIIVEPFTDSVVLLLTGDGETLSAICDVACATELRDKLSAALASPQPEAYGVRAAVIDECAKVAARFVHSRLYEAKFPACSYHSAEIAAAIRALSHTEQGETKP